MTMTPDATFTLQDRYSQRSGEVLITGVQALVRGPLDQLRADRQAGLHTTAFFSGYQGSPLGTYDSELHAQHTQLEGFGAVHRPGLNEELGATAVMGSQLSSRFSSNRYDGIVGVWYGKSPGVERASDAIHHAQFAGTSRHGGVLALAGDDPAAKSSTVPCRSEVLLASMGLPVLYPGTMQDVLDLCRHGIVMSRATGLWTGIKVLTPVADGTGIAVVDPDAVLPIVPVIEVAGGVWAPELTGAIGPPYSANRESDVIGTRMEMARLYVAENKLNRFVSDPSTAWLGIIAGGYTAEMVIDALKALGIGPDAAHDLGIRILKLGALNPLEIDAVRHLARGVRTVLVVEDKQPFLETLVRDALYGAADRPAVIGKLDEAGEPMVPLAGTQTVGSLTRPLRRLLATTIDAARLAPLPKTSRLRITIPAEVSRTPYFCSGCPHNTSTKVPDGALVGAGIGCHGMITMMDADGLGEIIGITQMGGEGSQWIGIAPFVEDEHLFQNIGDGTFFHSGQLSIQAAIAARVDMTFKLLYNSAVAMTGGQDATGVLAVPKVAAKLVAEGASRVVITTDEPRNYRGVRLPADVVVRHRDDIIDVQEELRRLPGVTVLIHDQQCAAEKRRDRKRGLVATPSFRVVIDERVCEGCGDCGVQSNCLSLQPLDTEFGRKTVIDQSSCNFDVSCLKGDCPAFLTVEPAASKGATSRTRPDVSHLDEPDRVVPHAGATVRMPGIGGTGVVTVAQIIAAAAKIDGLASSTVDQTGLSQKAGPVVSTIAIGDVVPGRVDTLLAFDLLATATSANVAGLDAEHTVVIASTSMTPTGSMVGKVATATLSPLPYIEELESRSVVALNRYADASALTIGLLGSSVTGNVFMLGVAFQAGAVPLSSTAIERAIQLNGTAVDANLDAFRWGRQYVVDPTAVKSTAGIVEPSAPDITGLEDLSGDRQLQWSVAVRRTELLDYQGSRLAERYMSIVRRCHAAEQQTGGDGSFTRTVAFQLHRVMAYKDEYEVARLLLGSRERVQSSFGPVEKVRWNLHPPMLRAMGMKHKLRLGPWATPAMSVLRSMRGLRGTPFDPFGYTTMRRAERRLATEYIDLVNELLGSLGDDAATATRVAGLVDMVRGYEHVKLRNLERYRTALAAARG